MDLVNNPDLVVWDAVISFKTAIWFWMTPQGNNKPSSHDVITNIINGGIECGNGPTPGSTFIKRTVTFLGPT